jgi:hypothetical protein
MVGTAIQVIDFQIADGGILGLGPYRSGAPQKKYQKQFRFACHIPHWSIGLSLKDPDAAGQMLSYGKSVDFTRFPGYFGPRDEKMKKLS